MSYGSKTNSAGEEIKADGKSLVIVGEKVKGNTIEYFGYAKDQNDNIVETRAEIKFRQTNGAVFTHSFLASEEEWAIDKTNRELLHICTKIISEVDYYAAIAGCTSFGAFIDAIKTKIMPKAAGKLFTLKISYKENKKSGKWFPGFPNFPNFIELDGTNPSTLNTNPKYDFYSVPAASNIAAGEGNVESTEEAPF